MADIRFSLSVDDGPSKLAAWREVLTQAFGPIEVGINSAKDFSGFVRTYRRQQLQFNEICYRGQTLERTPQNLASFDQEYFTLSRPISGPLLFEQNGRDIVVKPGSLVLLNQTSPYRATTEACYHAFSISIPKQFLAQRVPNIASFYTLDIHTASSKGRLLNDFAKYMSEGIDDWSEAELFGLREHLLDLIVLLMVNNKTEIKSGESSIKAAHRERALAYIHTHHCNPQLTPKQIAQAGGISTGYLHKIFQAVDLRVEQVLYTYRLETCKKLLINPMYMKHAIQQIAFHAGFSHPSHFSRLFKEKYGVTPAEFRSSVTAS